MRVTDGKVRFRAACEGGPAFYLVLVIVPIAAIAINVIRTIHVTIMPPLTWRTNLPAVVSRSVNHIRNVMLTPPAAATRRATSDTVYISGGACSPFLGPGAPWPPFWSSPR